MFKFLIRFLQNLIIFLSISFPLEIIGWFLLLPICYLSKSNQLPHYLKWFDNADSYLGRDVTTYEVIISYGWFNRYLWLAFRNPCNYFGYKILGFQATFSIPRSIVGDSINDIPGFQNIETPPYYEYYYIKKWSDTKCFRFRMGWKLSDTKPGDWVERVFVIQPYKSYSGNS